MFGLSKLTAALARLTGNVDALADTLGEANAGLRARLLLDGPDHPLPVPALEGPPDGDDAGDQAAPPAPRNGRRKAAAQ
jgi:hypothetical protein